MLVLGIESSCDETAVAIFHSDQGLVGHMVHSQIDLHAAYGGVVPELASRDHVRRLIPLLRQLLKDSGHALHEIEGVAYTSGPGLAGALLTGAVFARSLAWALEVPALAVHHMEGHLLAPMLESNAPEPPFVCLLVSGGHSQLIRVDAIGAYTFLGDTLDDAAGEAFDKTAKVLGLPYPGGPHLSKLAERGDATAFDFPRPMTDRPGLDFSFSGLKTAVMTAWNQCSDKPMSDEDKDRLRADLAASFESAIVDTLRIKCQRTLQQEHLNRLVISGGVSANRHLRSSFDEHFSKLAIPVEDNAGSLPVEVIYPSLEFCTDNAAMIAVAGSLRLAAGEQTGPAINVRPRWPLSELSAPGAQSQ